MFICLWSSGHLVCRDLSRYLLSLPPRTGNNVDSTQLLSSELPTGSVSPNVAQDSDARGVVTDSRKDALMLLSGMTFMKVQICYFGNMALRSSLSFAVLGSLLAVLIPVIIENEN